jgi:hypothetical protein
MENGVIGKLACDSVPMLDLVRSRGAEADGLISQRDLGNSGASGTMSR